MRRAKRPAEPGPIGEILIDESLWLSELLSLPVTVRLVGGERWVYPASAT